MFRGVIDKQSVFLHWEEFKRVSCPRFLVTGWGIQLWQQAIAHKQSARGNAEGNRHEIEKRQTDQP